MAIRPQVMAQNEERGEFNGNPLFVLHVIPHMQEHLKYVVGTPVDLNTAAHLKKYYRVIDNHAENLRNVELWTRQIEEAKRAGGKSSEEKIDDLTYDYTKLREDANFDASTLKKMTEKKDVKVLLVPADLAVSRWTVLSKKPKGTLNLEPGDYEYVLNRIRKIGDWNQAQTSSAVEKVTAALDSANATRAK